MEQQVQKKTAKEIVKETIEYYMENPSRRAVNGDNICYYKSPDGKMCAVGRCMQSPDEYMYGSADNIRMNSEKLALTTLLKEEYRGHNIEMWIDLQRWHDNPAFWEYGKITEEGKERAEELLKIYS